MDRAIKILTWIFIGGGALFASSSSFVDSQLMPKWFVAIGGGLLLATYCISRFLLRPKSSDGRESYSVMFGVIALLVFLQAVYGLLQYVALLPPTTSFRTTGSFDNPAGFAASLCAGFPFCLLGFLRSKGILRLAFALAVAVVALAVVFSESRAGVLSLVVVLLYIGVYRLRFFSKKQWRILIFVLLASVVSGLYLMKKDSANGRLFIWKCSLPMMADRWLAGHGTGGFEANYMNYQAAYFKKHPDSPSAQLADNVQYSFNEYIRVATDYGAVGLLLLLSCVGGLIYCYYKHPSLDNRVALSCWLAVGVFAFFSYPLMSAFVWIVLLFSLLQLIKPLVLRIARRIPVGWMKVGAVVCLLGITLIGFKSYQRIDAEMKWARIANRSLSVSADNILVDYRELCGELGDDRYFLYNYSASLYTAGRYQESLNIAKRCRLMWADYDVENLLGQLYGELNQYSEAINHYQQASYMCPNRFYPFYQQVFLLEKRGEMEQARLLAIDIINKSEKIPSARVNQMKDVLRSQYVERMETLMSNE